MFSGGGQLAFFAAARPDAVAADALEGVGQNVQHETPDEFDPAHRKLCVSGDALVVLFAVVLAVDDHAVGTDF